MSRRHLRRRRCRRRRRLERQRTAKPRAERVKRRNDEKVRRRGTRRCCRCPLRRYVGRAADYFGLRAVARILVIVCTFSLTFRSLNNPKKRRFWRYLYHQPPFRVRRARPRRPRYRQPPPRWRLPRSSPSPRSGRGWATSPGGAQVRVRPNSGPRPDVAFVSRVIVAIGVGARDSPHPLRHRS